MPSLSQPKTHIAHHDHSSGNSSSPCIKLQAVKHVLEVIDIESEEDQHYIISVLGINSIKRFHLFTEQMLDSFEPMPPEEPDPVDFRTNSNNNGSSRLSLPIQIEDTGDIDSMVESVENGRKHDLPSEIWCTVPPSNLTTGCSSSRRNNKKMKFNDPETTALSVVNPFSNSVAFWQIVGTFGNRIAKWHTQ